MRVLEPELVEYQFKARGETVNFAVYFAVFGIGIWYILRLMSHAPHVGELGAKRGDTGPIRTAGITPGPTQNPSHDEPLPTEKEGE